MVDPAMMRIDYVALGLFIAVVLIMCCFPRVRDCMLCCVLMTDDATAMSEGVSNVAAVKGKPHGPEMVHLVAERVGGGRDCSV